MVKNGNSASIKIPLHFALSLLPDVLPRVAPFCSAQGSQFSHPLARGHERQPLMWGNQLAVPSPSANNNNNKKTRRKGQCCQLQRPRLNAEGARPSDCDVLCLRCSREGEWWNKCRQTVRTPILRHKWCRGWGQMCRRYAELLIISQTASKLLRSHYSLCLFTLWWMARGSPRPLFSLRLVFIEVIK